jgi:ribosomal protein S18 acetylase RimI-like enzyme
MYITVWLATKSIYALIFIFRDAGVLLIIRDFRKEDLEDAIECAKLSFAEEIEVEGADPDVWRKLVRRRFSVSGRILFGLLRLSGKEPMKFFVATVNGKVVGTTMVTHRRKIGYVQTVMVHPDFRRRGIATELVKNAINYVRKRKFDKAILHVMSTNNPAKDLYQKLGFKKFEDTVYLTADIDFLSNMERDAEIQVRDFQRGDIDAVYTMIKNLRDPNWLKMYDFRKNDLKTSSWNRIARMSTIKKMVAIRDEKIVGYASLSCTTAKEAGRISTMEVSPQMLSKGIEELIRVSINYFKPSGTKTVLVTVPLTREELLKRLESLGFKKRLVMEGMVLE